MNAPEFAPSAFFLNETIPDGPVPEGRGGRAGLPGRRFLATCIALSLALHAFLLYGLDVRRPVPRGSVTLLLVDMAPPAPAPPPDRAEEAGIVARPPAPAVPTQPRRKRLAAPVRPAAVARARPRPAGLGPKTAVPREEAAKPVEPSPGANPPASRLQEREGVTILANESGQDALKHGAEARFMHGVATEEFVEDNYVGEYALGDSSRVWIEDDRARSGHLILHAEALGLHRALYRFNRFIYVYGDTSDSPSPILGSVTFFSDGYHIHQFLWEHNSTQAFFPRRK